ncbi:MAG: amidase [Acidimicrobiales bacterium]|jgi:amidase
MTSGDELCELTAVDLAGRLAAGEVSAREVLAAHLDRIERINPTVNAIVTLAPEAAQAQAHAADQAHANGESLGLLHGVPVAHKDLAATAGIRTTLGSPIFADDVPTVNDLIVQRQVDAGAVTVGKTNTPEFGAGSQTFNQVFGATLNPYDLSRTCGGSSGGAAVSLATRMLPLCDGSDMGGSLRNPASFCNVVGLRPSPGRVPSVTSKAAWSPFAVEGPMGRTVADVAFYLQALAGPDDRSPTALEAPGSTFAGSLDRDLTGVRVAWSPDCGGLPIDPAVRSALTSVPDVLSDLGCDVVEVWPDMSDAAEIFQTFRSWHFELASGPLLDKFPDQLKQTVIWNIEEARRRRFTDHSEATRMHVKLFRRVHEFMREFEFLACPVSQVPPFPVTTEWITEVDGVQMDSYIEWMRSCSDITTTGHPALSVPAGFTDDGLPIGVQLVGRHRADRSVLEFGSMFEGATRVGERAPSL